MSAGLAAVEKLLLDPGFHLEGRPPDGELRDSMAAHGWDPQFPAIVSAEGNVLAGHRRMAVAEELGIDPVIRTLPADTSVEDQIRLALLSNAGGKPFTREQRKAIARALYGTDGWTMSKIAEALSVSVGTVSGDLGEFSELKTHPSRGGRPRKPKAEVIPLYPEADPEPVTVNGNGALDPDSWTDVVVEAVGKMGPTDVPEWVTYFESMMKDAPGIGPLPADADKELLARVRKVGNRLSALGKDANRRRDEVVALKAADDQIDLFESPE
jgi:hypothetical protein